VRDVHLVLREEDGTWGGWSPTVEGLFVAAGSAREAVTQAKKTAEWELGELVSILVHHERVIDGLVLRVAGGQGSFEKRCAVAGRLENLIRYDRAQIDDEDLTRNSLGEAVFVCAVAGDRIGWVADQMDQRGDGVMVAALLDYDGTEIAGSGMWIWAGGLLVGPNLPGATVEGQGMSMDSTVAELLRSMEDRGRSGAQAGSEAHYITARSLAVA